MIFSKRQIARLRVVQAIYQYEKTQPSPDELIAEFLKHRMGPDKPIPAADVPLFNVILESFFAQKSTIEERVAQHLTASYTLAKLENVLRSIIFAGYAEHLSSLQTPLPVLLDSYTEIAKSFFGGKEPGFINAILQALVKKDTGHAPDASFSESI